MSSTTFTVLRCDRCAHEAEIRRDADATAWAKIQAVAGDPYDRGRAIGTMTQAADLCPGCTELIFAWWQSREPVVQPAPPADAVPTPRRFTIEDRRNAEVIAGELLREQVTQAFDAAREEPTSLLGGQIIAGGFAGVEDRAAAIVELVVASLEGRAAVLARVPPRKPPRRARTLSPTPDDTGAAA